MARLKDLKRHLRRGRVYRRQDLLKWSNAVDRHLEVLVNDGVLQKLSHGLYYYPKSTSFGNVPPNDEELVKSFLKGENFLLTSPNLYNGLGVGTTQLYNYKVVYNNKRHGEFTLGSKKFEFKKVSYFPLRVTREFLLVDLLNNLKHLAEDSSDVLYNVSKKVMQFDKVKLRNSLKRYGKIGTRRALEPFLS